MTPATKIEKLRRDLRSALVYVELLEREIDSEVDNIVPSGHRQQLLREAQGFRLASHARWFRK